MAFRYYKRCKYCKDLFVIITKTDLVRFSIQWHLWQMEYAGHVLDCKNLEVERLLESEAEKWKKM